MITSFVISIVALIFVLGVLIFVHELGHFMAAKAVGIGVPRFSIGFGRATPIRWRRGETEYQVAWIPLGGYVKMASKEEQEAMAALEGGETGDEFPPEKLFENKPLWARILTISAGVIMNALFAWVVYTGLVGFYGQAVDPTTTIDTIVAERLPEEAGALGDVPFGSRIERINGEEIESWNAVFQAVLDPTSKSLRFEFEGGVGPVEVQVPGLEVETREAIFSAMVPLQEAKIDRVGQGEPAHTAGLLPGDRVVEIDGEPIRSWREMVEVVEANPGRELAFVVERGEDERATASVVPKATEIERDGSTTEVGRIGVVQRGAVEYISLGPVEALAEGGRMTLQNAGLIFFVLKEMIFGRVSARELGGPIMIAEASGEFAQRGLADLFTFMAFLSINLAILNLLPIPVLDGGHLVFLVAEGLRGGRPLPTRLRYRLTNVGLVLLLMLMSWAVINDVLRLFGI